MRSPAPVLLLAVVVVVTLSACGTAAPTGPRLADAKAVVQLVRNEAADRIPTDSIAEVIVERDASEACASATVDPDGLERRWAASSIVVLTARASTTLESTYLELINSFSANGWTEVTYGGGGAVTLQKPQSLATLSFLATAQDDAVDGAATIAIAIESGCVMTAGPGSEEVALLESTALESSTPG